MEIGVLKEIKEGEKRVALRPDQASVLKSYGHRVYVENGAGVGSGFPNTEYEKNGSIVVSKCEVLDKARLLLKVKAPLPEEYRDYNENHTLFTYLHFDENIAPQQIEELISRGFLGIAYEWVGENKHYPLLQPMSRLTGYLFAQKALYLCAWNKGVFCSGNESFLPSAYAMIIGLGNIGLSTLKYFLDNKLKLTVLDNADLQSANTKANVRFKTTNIDYIRAFNIDYIQMDINNPVITKDAITKRMQALDIIICSAVRRQNLSKDKVEYLIDREMVSQMTPGSVICDATANDKDLIETCISSASLHYTYEVNGVIHYNCDHIPALVARTATQLLTQESFHYVLQMANNGIVETILSNRFLCNGVSCFKGQLTHKDTATKKGLPWQPIGELLHSDSVRQRYALEAVAFGSVVMSTSERD
ncbi:hypothetical protein [Dendronalium sp. ChiSLP03b]|uniref:hypothetical protein n=1 Tax=Dendronalium sp. ChiSLP03b TaxID=3075381 RepID=UPI002AD3EB54|nr:hypothetical protein [Dendronalium sp. ChiSLP03b]MDZ8206778.1 hypothetical protein [Dendronalium sp. ChiSLP03b]